MSAEIKKEYPNGELRVVWKPAICKHAGICVKMLPKVYDPKRKPWIEAGNATVEELKAQIDQCPSGALTYYVVEDSPAYVLVDNQDEKRYEFNIDDQLAKIEYIRAKDKIYLTHTEVPKSLGGKGIGSALIKASLEDIKAKDLTLIPLCPFVAAYIKKHPEWRSLVLKGINIA